MSALVGLTLCIGLALAAPPGLKVNRKVTTEDVDLLMPKVQPKKADTYLCTTLKMKDVSQDIVGFKPHANMQVTHHILLYGCTTPGSDKEVWNCGEMAQKGHDYASGPVCSSGSKIIYAWAMDAPSLKLPEGVGFEVGGDTDVKYIVMQVHYKDVTSFLPPKSLKDSSGVTLVVTDERMPRSAGVYLLGTGGHIPAHSTVYMETACSYNEPFEIHPFAFRTHAHSLGQVVSGYRIRNGEWTEIGRKSPKLPQMFYNATTPNMVVRHGDILAARCTMKNELNHAVNVGNTQNDEMCNFYIMYYVDGDKTMKDNYCFTQGPSDWYWRDFYRAEEMNLGQIPASASQIPGQEQPLQQTVEENLYDDMSVLDDIEDVENKLRMGLGTQDPESLAKLINFIEDRGPRAYDEDEDGYYLV